MKTLRLHQEDIQKAADIIQDGGLVAFPTETVYGLGANALDEKAVRKIFEAKGRPADNPLIVHIARVGDIALYAKNIPPLAYTLIEKFWPGALTLVLEKQDIVPDITTAGLSTVCLRMPDHPLALELIDLSSVPLAGPSANTSGRPSPTRSDHVLDDMDGRIDAVIEGSVSEIGIESTVLDLTVSPPVILRHGGITEEMLREYTELSTKIHGTEAKSPGMKYRHYAPDFAIEIIDKNDFINISNLILQGSPFGYLGIGEDSPHKNIYLFPTRELFSQHLFATFRKAEKEQIEKLYIERISSEGIGKGLMNRITKAASHDANPPPRDLVTHLRPRRINGESQKGTP